MIHAGLPVPLPYSLELCTLCTLLSYPCCTLYSVLCTLLSYPCCTLPRLLFGHVMQVSLIASDLDIQSRKEISRQYLELWKEMARVERTQVRC